MKRFGKNMKRALEFLERNPGWHTYDKRRSTVRAVKRLEKCGMVETNEFHQFRLKVNA